MFTSIISGVGSTLTIKEAAICSLAAVVIGLVISAVYMFCGKYTKNFAVSLAILPLIVQVVIMMVNGNLGTGMAVLGAFSLVRFRSVPGSSREICAIFLSMAIGLALGMGYVTFAASMAAVVCILLILLSKTPFGEKKNENKILRITIPENLDYNGVFDDIFEKYTKSVSLDGVKTTNLGSMYKLDYTVVMKNSTDDKKFIDELRCRNGNLTISLEKYVTEKDEL